MNFKQYLKEHDEIELVKTEDDKKTRLTDFIRTIDELNNDKFKEFATNELGMDGMEAETIVYKMLKDFLLKNDNSENADVEPDISELLDMNDDDELDIGAEDELDLDGEDYEDEDEDEFVDEYDGEFEDDDLIYNK